jgi:hypothetical protein
MEEQEQSRQDWKALEKTHAYGINTDKATEDQLEAYVITKMYVYERHNFADYTLWEVFAEDFANFEIDHFKTLRSATKARLRLLLISRGVFVGKRTGKLTLY